LEIIFLSKSFVNLENNKKVPVLTAPINPLLF